MKEAESENALDDRGLPLHNFVDATTSTSSPGVSGPTEKNQIRSTAFLTGLRGLAAFLVYFYHHISWFYGATDYLLYGWGAHEGRKYIGQLPFIRVFFTGGNPAVAIFFVLSGYVLSVSPLRSIRAGQLTKCYNGLISGAVRRPPRLYIAPIGVSLVVVLSMHMPFGLSPHMVWPHAESNLLREFVRWFWECLRLMNVFVGHKVSDRWFMYDPPAYTMPTELIGSWVLFFVLAVYSKATEKARFGLIAVTGVAFLLIGYWTLACFMGGAVLAMADQWSHDGPKGTQTQSKTIRNHAIFFMGWFLLSQPGGIREIQVSENAMGFRMLTNLIPKIYYNGEYWRWWHTWGALMLIYGVLRISWLQRFFSSSALQYLGRISFCLYLIHMPLIWTFSDRIYRLFGHVTQTDLSTAWDRKLAVPDWGIHGLTTQFLVSQSIITPVNIVLAHLGTVLLDEPSILVGRWVVQRTGLDKRL
jgi:peptidoglycan/LPS O-acetylase OafA/YrhL